MRSMCSLLIILRLLSLDAPVLKDWK